RRGEAEAGGYTVVEPQTVLSTHLMETTRRHAADLLSRQATRDLLDGLRETNPALVEDVVPNKVPLGTVHRVLQRLLREQIPIRDLVTILETLSDAGESIKDVEALTEHVRRSLSMVITQALGGTETPIRAITIGPKLEIALMNLLSPRSQEEKQILEPEQLGRLVERLPEIVRMNTTDGRSPALITPPALRLGVRKIVQPTLPRLPVVSLAELPAQAPIEPLAVWELENAA
ncbi:MAG: EscV/YscV/HrcV family type III secretion system export apparatus protein, partial [Candidatus Eisenbacteria bacterium]|nr:EscV/YscV/HrcV family type III secretion system export apparatus protein [Candidatus Latescibacterota bacterium]MBD3302451.1 EscV/YscV/HrcV family type III secretion system export apparatus protein [Candidatus Eisenbacteria bacterium]